MPLRSIDSPAWRLGLRHTGRLLACLASVIGFGAACPAADPPGWSLVWSDEFDRLDTNRWNLVDTNKPTNESLQDYLPGQVKVRDGRLVITAEDKPSRGLPYRSGQVISKSEQKLGRWEVRAKLPGTRGMWPAIWLLPDLERYPWPSGGEIDIVENRGNQPHLTSSAFHYGDNKPFRHELVQGEQRSAVGHKMVNYHDGFHTYAVDWFEDRALYYVDGMHHLTVHDEDVGGALSQAAPMRLMINNAIGGTFSPPPDDTTKWPQKMEIDWVRVFKPKGKPRGPAELANGEFEANNGSLSGWSVFGNRVVESPNVRVARRPWESSGMALKLFGTFSEEPSYSGASQGIAVKPGDRVTASLHTMTLSADSIAKTDNTLTLKIEFYDRMHGKYGSREMLDQESLVIARRRTVQDRWRENELSATAPPRAAEARVSIVFHQPHQEPGSVLVDDVHLTATPARKPNRYRIR